MRVERAGSVPDPLAAYFKAARGAISRNTERALRSDVQVFTTWCRRRPAAPFPANADTLVAFMDEMSPSRTPATVRRYVSSIGTVHRGLGQKNPLDSADVRFALQRHRLMGAPRAPQGRGGTGHRGNPDVGRNVVGSPTRRGKPPKTKDLPAQGVEAWLSPRFYALCG